jgi:hypothetical protein
MPPLKLSGDSILITPQTKNILPEFCVNNYVAFEPEQIHILGSNQDAKNFEEYMKNKSHKNQHSRNGSLEGKFISGLFILSFLVGIFLMPSNLTGNVIGTSDTAHRLVGIILFLLGISGFFTYRKLRS